MQNWFVALSYCVLVGGCGRDYGYEIMCSSALLLLVKLLWSLLITMSIDFASTPGEITLQQVHQICDLSMLRMYQFTMTQTKTPYFVLLYWSFFTQLG